MTQLGFNQGINDPWFSYSDNHLKQLSGEIKDERLKKLKDENATDKSKNSAVNKVSRVSVVPSLLCDALAQLDDSCMVCSDAFTEV